MVQYNLEAFWQANLAFAFMATWLKISTLSPVTAGYRQILRPRTIARRALRMQRVFVPTSMSGKFASGAIRLEIRNRRPLDRSADVDLGA
jgi:hypothetical protein